MKKVEELYEDEFLENGLPFTEFVRYALDENDYRVEEEGITIKYDMEIIIEDRYK